MKLTIAADRVETILTVVEDLLLDAAHEADRFTDDETGALRAFEAVATTAVEDGKPVILDSLVADFISEAARTDDPEGVNPVTGEYYSVEDGFERENAEWAAAEAAFLKRVGPCTAPSGHNPGFMGFCSHCDEDVLFEDSDEFEAMLMPRRP